MPSAYLICIYLICIYLICIYLICIYLICIYLIYEGLLPSRRIVCQTARPMLAIALLPPNKRADCKA